MVRVRRQCVLCKAVHVYISHHLIYKNIFYTFKTIACADANMHSNIPKLIHFLPGTQVDKAEWKERNPGYVGLSWDVQSIWQTIESVPEIKMISKQFMEATCSTLLYTLTVLYAYGGVCISSSCPIVAVDGYLQKNEKCILLLSRDVSYQPLIMSSARVQAYLSFCIHASRSSNHPSDDFKLFFEKCMEQSGEAVGSIEVTTSGLPAGYENVEAHVHFENNYVAATGDTEFEQQILDYMYSKGAVKSDDVYNIIVIDSASFDYEAPVPHALHMANVFQKRLAKRDVPLTVIVNHTKKEPGGDMFINMQLQCMNAKLLSRENCAIWSVN